jgi:hypothetical protein
VANQVRGEDCCGPITSIGYNLDSDGTCDLTSGGDKSNNHDAKLGPLQDNGGPTLTHALLFGSPAIDAGDPNGCTDPSGNLLTTDQRGFPRPYNGQCDMGAYEYSSHYNFCGFFPPVDNPPAVNNGRHGKIYPLAWQVRDSAGALVGDPDAIQSITVKGTSCRGFTGDPTGAVDAVSPGGFELRYSGDRFLFNWETPAAGCYTLFLGLEDGEVFPAYFNLK